MHFRFSVDVSVLEGKKNRKNEKLSQVWSTRILKRSRLLKRLEVTCSTVEDNYWCEYSNYLTQDISSLVVETVNYLPPIGN